MIKHTQTDVTCWFRINHVQNEAFILLPIDTAIAGYCAPEVIASAGSIVKRE